MKQGTCIECRYAVSCGNGKIECHRHAPQPGAIPAVPGLIMKEGTYLKPLFPQLESTNYCGEFAEN